MYDNESQATYNLMQGLNWTIFNDFSKCIDGVKFVEVQIFWVFKIKDFFFLIFSLG